MKNVCKKLKTTGGIGFVEIAIAVLIVAACAVPVVYMVTSSRTDTSKAINYLRAMELANEVIEWASVSEFSTLDSGTFSAFTGTLVEGAGESLSAMPVNVSQPVNNVWRSDGLMVSGLKYSEQYNKAYFFREVDVEDLVVAPGETSYLQPELLKRLTVRVKWNEAQTPSNPNIGDDRGRQVELSVLLLDEHNLLY